MDALKAVKAASRRAGVVETLWREPLKLHRVREPTRRKRDALATSLDATLAR